MFGPTPLLLVLTLLLSQVAGDISNSGSQLPQQAVRSRLRDTLPVVGASLLSSADAASKDASDALADELATELQRSLRFEPPLLDFGAACPVGTARAHTVTLINQNANRSVYLTSVSGRTPAFYSSFFEAKVVPPQGNTTFSVVFLPRADGAVTADLLIHTSFGQARLQVRGEGRMCPYRLKPLVGVKAPLNATLTPEIHMYNPHRNPLQILEVYSSGGQFQLELPTGGQEGPQALWEIPPYTTKPVIRIRFHARSSGNHTAYIRIKISEQPAGATSPSENVLVIPVEFEIQPLHGLYAENPIVDFGRLATNTMSTSGNSKTAPLQFKLQLRSSQASRPHEVIDFQLRNVTGLTFEPSDATLTLEPRLFTSTTVLDEVLVVRAGAQRNASQTRDFTVLIRAEVYRGTLRYDRNATIFVTRGSASGTTDAALQRRTLLVRNDFEHPLALMHVGLTHNDSNVLRMHLSDVYTATVDVATGEVVVPPGGSLSLLHLQLQDTSAVYQTAFRVQTNVTHFEIPVVVSSGRLHVSTYDAARLTPDPVYSVELNLGAIPLAEMSHDGYIVLRNHNKLPIKLNTWDFQSPQGVYFHTTFRGCLRPASLRALRNGTLKLDTAKFKLCTQLEEDDVAVFQVAIQSYITEQHTGTLKIWTAYEEITTTVQFRTWMGKLEVDQEQLYFKNCFPGKRCIAELSIRSTFQHPIHVTSINFSDTGLRFEDLNANGSVIAPNAVTKVGRIHFEPALLCQNRCYIPQDARSNVIAFPAPQQTKGGRNNNLHFDETELRRRTELFRHLKWYFQDIAFTLNSHEVRQFLLQLIIDIEWPKLVASKQTLPTIEAGKSQEVHVLLSNPADTPILVDYFLADPQYAKETQLSLPLEVVDISPHCYLADKVVFSLPNGAPRQPVLVAPHTSFPVLVRFEAPAADTYCTLLHIRNNLTLYEAVWLSAKTVQSQFRFGNRKPGSTTPLLFEVSEKHLASCQNQQPQTQQSPEEAPSSDAINYAPVVTRRTFTARNTGEIPIWVESFLIGDQPCAGYGFKVLDCSSFALKANDSKKIEIAFSPDFTASRISRPLTLRTNLSYDVEYVLLAQLPAVSLDQCAALLPRPVWEERVRNAAIVFLATAFIFVLIAAHIDYGNILISQSALYMARDRGPVHPTFNLRNIALKAAQHQPAEEELQSSVAAIATTTAVAQVQAAAHAQRRNPAQQKSSGIGGGGGGGGGGGTSGGGANNLNSNLKKRSLRRNNHTNGGMSTSANHSRSNSALASLPWPLDLGALKYGASGKVAVAADSTCGNENGNKPNVPSPLPRAPHTDKADPNNGNSSGSGSVSGAAKKQPQQQQLQSQQSRSVKKLRNVSTTAASALTVSSGSGQDKLEAAMSQQKQGSVGGGGSSKCSKTVPDSIPLSSLAKANVGEIGAQLPPVPISPIAAKDMNGSARSAKYGKTPGRERRREMQHHTNASSSSASVGNDAGQSHSSSASCSSNSSSNSGNTKRSERKQRQKLSAASQALNFDSVSRTCLINGASGGGDTTPLNCIKSPWETSSQVSFSDVLQTQTTLMGVGGNGNGSGSGNFSATPLQASMTTATEFSETVGALGALYGLPKKSDSEHSLLDMELKRRQSEAAATQDRGASCHVGCSAVLDKSGNNSAELGPIGSKKSPSSTPVWEPVNSQAAVGALQMPKPTMTPNCSFFSNVLHAYDYDGGQPIRGVDVDLFDRNKMTEEYIGYMYMRQQLEAQVHAHVQAQAQAQAQAQVQAQAQAHQQLLQQTDWGRPQPCTWSPMASYLGSPSVPTSVGNGAGTGDVGGAGTIGGGGWQLGSNGAAVVRPPPGLEPSFAGVNNMNNMHHTVAAQQQKQQLETGAGDTNEMQPYDPFSSLSAIWSDSWQKSNSNNNNHSNNNSNMN